MQQGKNVFNRDKDVGGWGSLTVNGELGSLKEKNRWMYEFTQEITWKNKLGDCGKLHKKYVVKITIK